MHGWVLPPGCPWVRQRCVMGWAGARLPCTKRLAVTLPEGGGVALVCDGDPSRLTPRSVCMPSRLTPRSCVCAVRATCLWQNALGLGFTLVRSSGGTTVAGKVVVPSAFVQHTSTITVTLSSVALPHVATQTQKLPFSQYFEFTGLPVRCTAHMRTRQRAAWRGVSVHCCRFMCVCGPVA
jgi:hypothetical protein